MNNRIAIGLGLLTVSWSGVVGAEFDGSQPLLCASATVIECLPVAGCHQVAPQAVAAPTFLRLDLTAKTLTSAGTGGTGDQRGTSPENGKRPDGGSGRLNLEIPFGGGPNMLGSPRSGTWGVFSRRSVRESMHAHPSI